MVVIEAVDVLVMAVVDVAVTAVGIRAGVIVVN